MEWLGKLNEAMEYVESNITNEVDYAQAAALACCSLRKFQNMFMFITDITLAEYVRRRKMALSAAELISSNVKIIDLSYKYGYESPDAFTRSFKAFHGISPSDVRKFNKYIDYPRLSFEIKIIGGHYTMNDTKMEVYKDILIKMEIIELPDTLKFAGVTNEKYEGFKNINAYNKNFKTLMKERQAEYVEMGLSSNICPHSWYAFGCRVDSIDGLPDGMVGLDTGLKKFACLTFRVQPNADLLGDAEGGGDGMKRAGEYLNKVWIPKNTKLLYDNNMEHGSCTVLKQDADFRITNIPEQVAAESYRLVGAIEYYKNIDMKKEPEMCFYLPLADKDKKPLEIKTLTTAEIKEMQVAPAPYETMKFGGYDWRVLDKQDDKTLILSEYVLDVRPYHNVKGTITWEKCSLREYLNGEFYNSFSDEDRARILLTKDLYNKNPWYSAATGKATDDCIFCLSVNEAVKYFGDSGDLESRRGWYWVGNKEEKDYDFELTDGSGQFLIDQYNESRIAKTLDGKAEYWILRTPGRVNRFNTGINSNGSFIPLTGGGIAEKGGVRPAMWVKC